VLPLLQIEDLTISFNQTAAAVNNISFSILPGEVVALVGESGSGKSITALSILQLLPKTAQFKGSIRFNPNTNQEVELLLANKKEIKTVRGNKISMIFQEPMTSLNPIMKCGSQVLEALKNHQSINDKEARLKVIELFTLVELSQPDEIFERYPHQLSGGQKQRVMIAMAMICHPALLVADEPTTALDVRVQQSILHLLKQLRELFNMSVLLITHDLGIVADIADRVMVMQNGNIVESGATNEVLKSPSHSYTKELRASSLARIKKEKNTQEIKRPISKTPLLEVVDICVNYTSVIKKHKEVINAVDHVSFNIYENEIVGLVGESGCGKTTLGRTILQLIKPSSGQIKLKGKDITGIASSAIKKLRQDFQIVFQDPYGSLNPRLSIGNAIMEVLKAHQLHDNDNKRREKVIELLEKVQLPADFFSRYPHQFSGGQRQRICFARALATAPSFIVFDEALSALDLNIQSSMLSLINNLKLEFGFSALFISHDLGLVKQICDRIMVMQKGAIIESGSTESIFNQPSHDYTKQLLEAIPGKRLFI